MKRLTEIFAISVGGFAVLDNHLHMLVRLDPDGGDSWSAEEIARRWAKLFPPRNPGKDGKPRGVTKEWIDEQIKKPGWVPKMSERLKSLSWFMKSLKEPLSWLANQQDGTKGTFFQGRFKSIAIIDNNIFWIHVRILN